MEKIDLNQVAKDRERILFVLVLLVLIISFFKVFYTPQIKKIGIYKGQLTALNLEKQALLHFSQTTPVIERSSTLSRKKGTKVKILLGEARSLSSDVSKLLAQLTDPDFQKAMAVKDISYQPPTKENGYFRSDFTLHLLGDFLALLQYLERLEQFPALFSIESIGIKTIEGRPQELETEIIGRFFQWSMDRERRKP